MISWSLFVGDGETDTSLDRFVDFLLASPFAEIQVPLDTRNEFELTKQLWTSPHSSPPVLTPHHQSSLLTTKRHREGSPVLREPASPASAG